MVLRRLNQVLNVDFSLGTADLKKNVSVYTQKPIRQKREGISASQL